MKIAIGNDHRGYALKLNLIEYLKSLGHVVIDMGFNDTNSSDHPIPAFKVAEAVAKGEVDRGVLICGSGVGMVVAANKVKGIAAFNPTSELHAKMSREHNGTNVLVFGSDFIGAELAHAILKIWLETESDNSLRFVRRRTLISNYEKSRG